MGVPKGVKRPDMVGILNPCHGKNMTGANNPRWKGGEKQKRKRYRQNNPHADYFNHMRSRSKPLGFLFNLPSESFKNWFYETPNACEYCKRPVTPKSENRMETLSIDRKNNSLGYTLENICKACNRCNTAKGNFFSYEQFKEIALKYFLTSA